MLFVFFIFLLGLIFGSFISALTYRLPRGIPFVFERSFCPICKKTISWYDNIPLFSFIALGGKCRNCKKRISWRYPFIEFSTAVGFVLVYIFLKNGIFFIGQDPTLSSLSWVALPYLLIVFLVLEIIFIIDLEYKVIFDIPVFFLFFLFIITSILISDSVFWMRLFFAFLLSFILLFLSLITKGRGMGLGDVKLALPLGFFLGFPSALVWIFVSFLTGALVGIILVLMGKAKFGRPVPFGPFLIFSFWLVLFLEDKFSFF